MKWAAMGWGAGTGARVVRIHLLRSNGLSEHVSDAVAEEAHLRGGATRTLVPCYRGWRLHTPASRRIGTRSGLGAFKLGQAHSRPNALRRARRHCNEGGPGRRPPLLHRLQWPGMVRIHVYVYHVHPGPLIPVAGEVVAGPHGNVPPEHRPMLLHRSGEMPGPTKELHDDRYRQGAAKAEPEPSSTAFTQPAHLRP